MPLQKLQLRPGINKESTTLANQGTWFEMDKARFRSGYPEKIGGWVTDTGTSNATLAPPTGSFWGVCRSLFNWITLSSYNLLGLGTNLKFYIQSDTGGTFYDVTPIRSTTAAGDVTFAATNGSTTLTVTDNGHGAQAGDFVTYSGAIALSTQTYTADIATDTIIFTTALANGTTLELFTTTSAPAGLSTGITYFVVNSNTPAASCKLSLTSGGVAIDITTVGVGTQTFALTTGITATVLNKEYQVATVTSNNVYTITSTVAANALDVGNGGAFTVGAYQITTGSDIYTQSVGWGAGGWGGIISGVATTAVSGALSAINTTVTVTSTTGFTATGNILIDSETISYTGVTVTTFTGCTRGVNGAGSGAATTHTNGTAVVQSTTFTGWGSPAPSGVGLGIQLRLWSQANFGQDLIFNPRGGGLYYWDVNANANIFDRGTLLTAGDTPDICNFVLVSDASRFVICFGVNGYGSAIQNPMLVRWSDQEDYTQWTPAITNQAGSFTLSDGSTIITAKQARQEILVWTDSALYSMQYLGPPYVWGFQVLAGNLSIISPNATATVNNVTYWMGVDKFYVYSGRVETLYCSLREYIFNDINLSQSFQFFANTNEGFNEIWWFYCSAGSTTVDRYVIYNHLEKIWYYGDLARTAWLDSPLRSSPMATGYNGQLIYHESGVDDGTTNPPTAITSFCQSADFNIGDGNNYAFGYRIVPDITFNGSTVNNPSVTLTLRPRQNPGSNYGSSATPTVASTQNYQSTRSYEVQQFTEIVYVRFRGRQIAFKISSNTLGTQWQLGVPLLDIKPDGRR